MKKIQLSEHCKQQCIYRGTNRDEISEVISTSKWSKAELGRIESRKDFVYNQEWNGKFYKTKQVRPIFAEEVEEIMVVTVYVYYF